MVLTVASTFALNCKTIKRFKAHTDYSVYILFRIHMDFLCGRVSSRSIVVVSCVIILSALAPLWMYAQLCVKVEPIESQKSVETGRAGETTSGKDAQAITQSTALTVFVSDYSSTQSRETDGGGFPGNKLEYTIKLAKRVKEVNALLVLDPHYSDTWADPGKQYTPEAWRSLCFDQLVEKVHEYKRDTVTAFHDEGVLPDTVQIGNEITCGIL